MTISLPGYAGSATDASAFVAGNNTSSEDGSSTATASATSSGGGGGGFTGGAACALPPIPNPADDSVRNRTDEGLNNPISTIALTKVEAEFVNSPAPQVAPVASQALPRDHGLIEQRSVTSCTTQSARWLVSLHNA